MKGLVLTSSVALIIGHLLTECYNLFPLSWRSQQFSLFLKPGFQMKIYFSWYIKMMMDDMLVILVFFILARMAKYYNSTLYYIAIVYFWYHVVDLLMFLWDFKQSHLIYDGLLVASGLSVLLLLRKHPMHKVK